jgi:hypothetical protein
MVKNNDYFQFIFDCYSRTGLRQSSGFFHKCVVLYVLYPLLLIFYFMVIFNLRFRHNDIFDFADVFNSISVFENVLICSDFKHRYNIEFFSSYSEKHLL